MINIRDLHGEDTREIAAFLSGQTGSPADTLRKRLAWLLRNPALTPDIPFGIGAFQDTCLRGVMMCVPNRFRDGRTVRTCILSALFYVDHDALGASLPLFFKFRALASRYPLYAATANAVSGRLWSRLGGTPVADSNCEYVRVCRVLPIGQEVLARAIRRSSSRPCANAGNNLSQYTHNDHLLPLATPDAATEAGRVRETGQYEIVRDADFFRWKIYQAGEKVYAYRFGDSECLCVFQHSRRGYRRQIACTEIVDLCGRLAACDVSDFLCSIGQAFSPDTIVFRGCSGLAGTEALAREFRRRRFSYSTVWLMDPNRLLESRFGYCPLAGE
jgi:hypothetical protein